MSVGIILLLLVLAGGVYAVVQIRRQARRISQALFGTEDLAAGISKQRRELSVTPKSVSGMTKVFLPQIEKDFPEFNWAEFRQKSENQLIASLTAISTQDLGKLSGASSDLRNQIQLRIEDLKQQKLEEIFEQITIHRTEITGYQKAKGICTVVLQSAVGYYHYTMDADAVHTGSKEYLEQTKYNMELQYVQDVSKLDRPSAGLGVVCPQCGAPITRLGAKYCEYCGSGVIVINIHAWALNKIYEV